MCFKLNPRWLRRARNRREWECAEALKHAKRVESTRDRIEHYSALMDTIIVHYDRIREAIEEGAPSDPDVFTYYSDISVRGTDITNILYGLRNNEENPVTSEAIAKIDKSIEYHEYSKKALALTFILQMNNMKLAPAHRHCPGAARSNLVVEFTYISHLLCAQICEMEALVKRVKRNDPTVKQHDLKMARLLPLKLLYTMRPRVDELAPYMPEDQQQAIRRYEIDIRHFVAVLTTLGGLTDEERLARVFRRDELIVGGDIWAEIPLPR